MADDPMLREMTSDPKFRKVLITDGKTAVGQALAEAVIEGRRRASSGSATPSRGSHARARRHQQAAAGRALVPLDLTDENLGQRAAGEIGGKVDIVVNNAELHRAYGIAARRGTDVARAEMDINYFGLLRLAQAFGPALKGARGRRRDERAAWVNLLSVYALSNFPPHGTFSASKAAAHSLAQCLRAEMRPAASAWSTSSPARSTTNGTRACRRPRSRRRRWPAIVKALRDGSRTCIPGDVAQEWLERWRDNPKALERELGRLRRLR